MTGHRISVSVDGGKEQSMNINNDFDWAHCYTKMYPAGAARIIEVAFDINMLPKKEPHTLKISPLDPGIVFQKLVVDCGGYEKTRLYMKESEYVHE